MCSAGLELLGRDGSRAVTHRAVDAEAGLPSGTTSNYFRSRTALFEGMAEELFVLLAPEVRRVEELGRLPAEEAGPEYVGYIVERLLTRPHLARAWFELRLEATRSAEMGARVGRVLQGGFAADVSFHEERGLPGGEVAVALLHHLVDGIILDAVTMPLRPDADPVADATAATSKLLSR